MSILLVKLLPVLLVLIPAWLGLRGADAAMRRELDEKARPLDDGALLDVVQRYREAIGIDALSVQIYDVEPVNAMAAPDGRIFLTRGLVEGYRRGALDASHMAAIVAHEIGHLALGHHAKRRWGWRIETATRAGVVAAVPRPLAMPAIWATTFVSRLLMLRLSRADEFEADAFAAALMRHAGFDPAAMGGALKGVEALSGNRRRPPAWLASHPPTDERIAALADRERIAAE